MSDSNLLGPNPGSRDTKVSDTYVENVEGWKSTESEGWTYSSITIEEGSFVQRS